MKLLNIYGTTAGQTRKIANFTEAFLQKAAQWVTITDTIAVPSPANGFHTITIGSSIHTNK